MKWIARWMVLLVAVSPGAVAARERRTVGLFAGVGYLGSRDAHGAAFSTGLRYSPCRALALSLDVGYGSLVASDGVQDRWWVIPSLALVLPAGRVRVDVGAGAG